MGKWEPCGRAFITGDVIRWVEPVWKPKARKTEKGRKIGARLVTGQVTAADAEWVTVEVLACDTRALDGWTAEPLKSEIHRRRGPIADGGAERMLHEDESARSITGSVFMKGEEPAPVRAVSPPVGPQNWPPAQGREGGGVGRTYSRSRKNGPRSRPRAR